jgi:hypothetical protein
MGGRMMTFTYVSLLSGLVAFNTPGDADSIMSRISVSTTRGFWVVRVQSCKGLVWGRFGLASGVQSKGAASKHPCGVLQPCQVLLLCTAGIASMSCCGMGWDMSPMVVFSTQGSVPLVPDAIQQLFKASNMCEFMDHGEPHLDAVLCSAVLCCVMLRLPAASQSCYAVLSFYLLMPFVFMSLFTSDKRFFAADTTARLYHPFQYYMAKVSITLPFNIIVAIVFHLVYYGMIGMRHGTQAMGMSCFISLLMGITAMQVGGLCVGMQQCRSAAVQGVFVECSVAQLRACGPGRCRTIYMR